jgi:hypothetical protein
MNPAKDAPARRSSAGKYVALALIIGAVVLVAWYQEQIGFFFKLKGWDREGPSRAVTQFLSAGKQGDRASADRILGSSEFKPLTKDGKWVGYLLQSNAGTLHFLFNELAPDSPKATGTEFIYLGRGAANVSVPDAKGKPVRYRLEVIDNQWKITEILGGRPA